MTAIVFCRKPRRTLGWLGFARWALGTSDRRGQDKSRKVRTVGSVRNRARFSTCHTRCEGLAQLGFFDNALAALGFCHLMGQS